MRKNKIDYRVDTFPTSEQFQVFRVYNDVIWQILTPKAYNIDTGEVEYLNMIFDDPVTAEIICQHLQEAQEYDR